MNESMNESTNGLEIAVVGMSGRFHGANTIEAFWSNLKNGVESLSHFTEDELAAAGVPEKLLNHPSYVKGVG